MNRTRLVVLLQAALKLSLTQLLMAIVFTCTTYAKDVNAQDVLDREVSIIMEQAEVKKVLTRIKQQTKVEFVYSSNVVQVNEKVSITARQKKLKDLLDEMLRPLHIGYRVVHEQVVLFELKNKENNPPAAFNVSMDKSEKQDRVVTGKVTSQNGEALSGVSVMVKGTAIGATTDAAGNFSLSVPEGSTTLVFSYVGYQSQEVAVGERTFITISLSPSGAALNEVVVIGYGTANKRDLTGSIVTIKAKELADKPAANPMSLLQGKVAGLSVVNSGRPGAEPDIRIRGTNSVNGVKPVYVVDGILNDNINFLNPGDIESIEVLKDPSSLAIFGVRGANGAIVISTKKARAGQLLVNFNSSAGIKKVQDRMALTNAAQFRELYAEQLKNQGAGSFNFSLWNADTDWQDQIFQDAFFNYNSISITGATEKNRFYIGLGYIDEEGIIRHEQYKKYTLNFSDELRVKRGLKFGVTFNAYRAEMPLERGVGGALRAAPIAPVMEPSTGLYHTLPAFQRAQVSNPLVPVEVEKNTLISRQYRGVGSIYGDVDFLKNFNFRVQLFADYGFNTSRSYLPIIEVYNPEIVGNSKRDTSRRATSVAQSQDIFPKTQMDYLLNYKKKFGDHDVTALGGVTTYYRAFEGTNSSVQQGTAMVIPNNPDKWYTDAIGDPATKLGSGSAWEDASLSYLARVLYSFQNKYLVNASFRRDGSSQFYRLGNQWKNFGALGVGWVVSNEDFFDNLKVLDYLKLKGSWGVLGNKNIDDRWRYPAFPTLSNANSGVFGNNVVAALEREFIPDENLNWETVHSYEAGIELNTFKNRLHFEANYYNKITKDILTVVEGPTGTIPGLGNLGEIKNNGIELVASWNQQITKELNFSVSGNLTTINNQVTRLNKNGFSIFNGPSRTTAGFPIGYFYGYVHDGIYQTDAEILRGPISTIGTVQPGDIRFKDIDGDGKITVDDRTFIGNPTPDLIYGGSLSLNYKGLDLGIDLQGVYGNEIFRAWNQGTFADFNYLVGRADRWNGINSSNWEPILSTKRAINYQNSSYWIEDGSFFRIRNVQLGYSFGQNLLNRVKVKTLRLFINAQNPATFANNTGYTPEIGGSATAFGVDNGTYPVPAVYSAGINLNF